MSALGVVRRADAPTRPAGVPVELRGGEPAARGRRSGFGALALVGVVVVAYGPLLPALRAGVAEGRVAAYDVVTDPSRLARLPPVVLRDCRPDIF
ncbi:MULTISPECIES: hypothetical protein [Kitasatospora]|uniref:hypothetical protein n=1 Tax=Kitasatospora TaxID=2063 RepID=UPI000CB645EA|nr:hypothetical protein [Kitasatospora sp. GP30]MDH6139760.1 hypothetical protein [Kitasatospora sp. GP30]